MEKPAQYDNALRIATRASQDRMDYARKYAILHDTFQPTDTDKDDAPSWRGDHSFNADAAAYSLSNFIEPEVKKKHPDWSEEMVHEEAVRRFEKRLEQDLSYEKRETRHEETTVRWEIVETAPGVKELATAYGGDMITLKELWDHTREFAAITKSPGSYNAEEAKAQLAMQDAFIRGDASGFVSVLSHPDSIRYVQVWEKAEEGDIVSKQIDLFSATGRDFSSDESVALIQTIADYQGSQHPVVHTEETSTYAHFFVREGNRVEESAIKTIAIAQTLVREEERIDDRLPAAIRVHTSVAERVSADTLQATKDMVVLFQSYLSKKIEKSHVPQTEEKRRIRKKNREADTPVEPVVHANKELQKQDDASRSMDLVEHAMIRSVTERAGFLPIAPVAFLAIASRQEQTEAVQKQAHEPKKTERVMKYDRAATDTVLSKDILRVWTQIMSVFLGDPDTVVKKEKPVAVNNPKKSVPENGTLETPDRAPSVDTLIRMLHLFAQFFRTDLLEKEHSLPKRREKFFARHAAAGMYPIIHTDGRRLDTFTALEKRFVPESSRSKQDNERIDAAGDAPSWDQAVLGKMLFSYVLWMVVQPPLPKNQREKIPLKEVPKEKKTKEIDIPETPWILLSIIWQLAMIRESGMATSTMQSPLPLVSTPQNTPDPSLAVPVSFPDHGIIFSAALHDRINHSKTSGIFDRLYSYG